MKRIMYDVRFSTKRLTHSFCSQFQLVVVKTVSWKAYYFLATKMSMVISAEWIHHARQQIQFQIGCSLLLFECYYDVPRRLWQLNFSPTICQCRVLVTVVAATCHRVYCRQKGQQRQRQRQHHGWKKNQLINRRQQEAARRKEGTQSRP